MSAWALAIILGLVVTMRLAWHDGLWLFLLADMATPYLFVPAWFLLAAALWARRWRLAALTGALAAFHAHTTLLPLLPHRPPAATGRSLKVVSANLLMVHENPAVLADELDAWNGDVYFLQEVSARWDQELERRGFWRRYPWNRRVVAEDSFGCAIASRWPVRDLDVFWLAELPEMRGVLTFEGREIELVAVHLLPPRTGEYVATFHRGVTGIVDIARRMEGRAFIVAGDFNATSDSLLEERMRPLADDVWELAGQGGLGATWPNGLFPVPPLRLDHVFISRELTATDVVRGVGAGSDHRPLVTHIALRAR